MENGKRHLLFVKFSVKYVMHGFLLFCHFFLFLRKGGGVSVALLLLLTHFVYFIVLDFIANI